MSVAGTQSNIIESFLLPQQSSVSFVAFAVLCTSDYVVISLKATG